MLIVAGLLVLHAEHASVHPQQLVLVRLAKASHRCVLAQNPHRSHVPGPMQYCGGATVLHATCAPLKLLHQFAYVAGHKAAISLSRRHCCVWKQKPHPMHVPVSMHGKPWAAHADTALS
jgi:hypothetical protein